MGIFQFFKNHVNNWLMERKAKALLKKSEALQSELHEEIKMLYNLEKIYSIHIKNMNRALILTQEEKTKQTLVQNITEAENKLTQIRELIGKMVEQATLSNISDKLLRLSFE